jgi:hypothetical protein
MFFNLCHAVRNRNIVRLRGLFVRIVEKSTTGTWIKSNGYEGKTNGVPHNPAKTRVPQIPADSRVLTFLFLYLPRSTTSVYSF